MISWQWNGILLLRKTKHPFNNVAFGEVTDAIICYDDVMPPFIIHLDFRINMGVEG